MRVGTYAANQLEAYARQKRTAHKGEKHANAKQTRESVMLIKDMYAHGVSQEAIACLLQVSQSGISKILLGASYVETV
jgi:predicted XRE-type DNA-binding protein